MLGRSVGNYRVISKIGQGGMGVVYLAQHKSLGRRAAVKVLVPRLSSNEDLVSRFFNEARAATAIRNPGIVEVFDFGFLEDRSAYIVMEYLDGESLAARIRKGRSKVTATLILVRAIARVLQAAHELGIVHRDLKPDNIFLIPDPDLPNGDRVKLLDFGIAKLTTIMGETGHTPSGTVMGTPTYMAPEQCRGAGAVDHRADLYSLGCIAYEMLCGQPPFVADGVGELIARHLYFQPTPPRDLRSDLRPEVESFVLRLLHKDAAARPSTANEVMHVIDRLIATAPTVVPRSEPADVVPVVPRRRRSEPLVPPVAARAERNDPVDSPGAGRQLHGEPTALALAAGRLAPVTSAGERNEPLATTLPSGRARSEPGAPTVPSGRGRSEPGAPTVPSGRARGEPLAPTVPSGPRRVERLQPHHDPDWETHLRASTTLSGATTVRDVDTAAPTRLWSGAVRGRILAGVATAIIMFLAFASWTRLGHQDGAAASATTAAAHGSEPDPPTPPAPSQGAAINDAFATLQKATQGGSTTSQPTAPQPAVAPEPTVTPPVQTSPAKTESPASTPGAAPPAPPSSPGGPTGERSPKSRRAEGSIDSASSSGEHVEAGKPPRKPSDRDGSRFAGMHKAPDGSKPNTPAAAPAPTKLPDPVKLPLPEPSRDTLKTPDTQPSDGKPAVRPAAALQLSCKADEQEAAAGDTIHIHCYLANPNEKAIRMISVEVAVGNSPSLPTETSTPSEIAPSGLGRLDLTQTLSRTGPAGSSLPIVVTVKTPDLPQIQRQVVIRIR